MQLLFVHVPKEFGKSLFGNENFEVVVNGIDMKRYLNPNLEIVAELKNKFDIKETDIVLGHIGSFSENKNQEFLIELVQELVKKIRTINCY